MTFRIVPAGDSAIVVEFDEQIDPEVNARAITLADALQAPPVDGVRDIVPTYRSVAVYFDPLRTNADALVERLEIEGARAAATTEVPRSPLRIPVCYGGEFGPDLPHVASFGGMTEADAVAAHCAPVYRVFMLGFVPGFTYMGLVDRRIAVPRRATPRVRVAAGSVGIAGVQTGIYPTETPGGWQLIGRTPIRPFDSSRPEPFLMKAGDAVTFFPIARDEFDRWPSST